MSVDAISTNSPTATLDEKNQSLLGIGEFQGKKVFHWSFYIQAVGALGGVIIAIAGLALAMPALLAPGILFFASNAIGAYYVHTFSVYSQLDTYVNQLQEKLTAAQADLIQQSNINKQLDELLKKTQKEIAAFQETAKKSLADWAEREKSLKAKVDAFEKVTDSIEKERKQALSDFDKWFKELHAEYIILETNKKAVDAQIIVLKEEVKDYKDTNISLGNELAEFKTNYDKFDKENDELKQINDDLIRQVKELADQIKTVPKIDTKIIVKELNETETASNNVVDISDILVKKLDELLKS